MHRESVTGVCPSIFACADAVVNDTATSLLPKQQSLHQRRVQKNRVIAARHPLEMHVHLETRSGADRRKIQDQMHQILTAGGEGRLGRAAVDSYIAMLRQRSYDKAGGAVSFGTDGGREKTTASVAEECLPPRVLIKGKCQRDPRGDTPPKNCLRTPAAAGCRKWQKQEKKKWVSPP